MIPRADNPAWGIMGLMSSAAEAPPWLVVPVSDLMGDLWRWPGRSEFLELYIARPILSAIAAQAAFKPTEIGGYLLGRHYILREVDGHDRQVVLITNYFQVQSAGGDEFNFTPEGRAKDLARMREAPELANLELVGWFHSHHNRGAFLSPSVDQPLHRRYFPEPYQVAYVLDMQRKQAGFFLWEGADLLAAPGQCLALFDPSSLEVKAVRRGRRKGPSPVVAHITSLIFRDSLRDGLVAIVALLVGLGAFVHSFQNRPFLAWTKPGSLEMSWEATGTKAAGYAVYRSGDADSRPDASLPILRRSSSDRAVDFAGRDKARIAQSDIGKRYWYWVAAMDDAGKPFRWSRPVPLVVPQIDPPKAPLGGVKLSDARDRITVTLPAFSAADTVGYWVVREGPLTSKKIQILNGGRPLAPGGKVSLTDTPNEPGAYRYLTLVQDWSGNLSQPWDSAAIALSGRQRGPLGLF